MVLLPTEGVCLEFDPAPVVGDDGPGRVTFEQDQLSARLGCEQPEAPENIQSDDAYGGIGLLRVVAATVEQREIHSTDIGSTEAYIANAATDGIAGAEHAVDPQGPLKIEGVNV